MNNKVVEHEIEDLIKKVEISIANLEFLGIHDEEIDKFKRAFEECRDMDDSKEAKFFLYFILDMSNRKYCREITHNKDARLLHQTRINLIRERNKISNNPFLTQDWKMGIIQTIDNDLDKLKTIGQSGHLNPEDIVAVKKLRSPRRY